jgi:hypothetical protein
VNGLIASGAGDDCIRVFDELRDNVSTLPGEGLSYEMVLKQEKAHSTDVNCVRWHPKVCAIFHLWHPSSIYESKPCFICCPSVTFHQHVSFDCLLS